MLVCVSERERGICRERKGVGGQRETDRPDRQTDRQRVRERERERERMLRACQKQDLFDGTLSSFFKSLVVSSHADQQIQALLRTSTLCAGCCLASNSQCERKHACACTHL